MKRSGGHAIANWLSAHDRFVFFNNIIPIAPILRGERTIPSPEYFRQWQKSKGLTGPFGLRSLKRKLFHRKFSLMVSLEDHDLQVVPFLAVPYVVTHILVLRDPSNMFSSRIRKASKIIHPAYPRHEGSELDRAIRTWKGHASEYLGVTHHLDNKVCIYFDQWFTSQAYRRSISQQLKMDYTDRGFSSVSGRGGGSSFDGTRFNGDNQTMDVLNRQGSLNGEERALLESIMSDAEMQNLAKRVRPGE